jgi:hypothetical protein
MGLSGMLIVVEVEGWLSPIKRAKANPKPMPAPTIMPRGTLSAPAVLHDPEAA